MGLTATFWTIVLLIAASVLAAPTSTTTDSRSSVTNTTPVGNLVFSPEPHGRGTWGIIFSCTVTFGVCVWTTVHPNIVVDSSDALRLLHKLTLMVVAIVVPEGVFMCALGEFLQARELRNAWRKKLFESRSDQEWHCKDCKKDIPSNELHTCKNRKNNQCIGMEGAFFVVMGGVVIEWAGPKPTKPIEQATNTNKLPEDIEQATNTNKLSKGIEQPANTEEIPTRDPEKNRYILTPAGLLWCMEKNKINKATFDKQAIIDKSKSNGIGKLLSIVQILWLAIQCIGRWRAGLPLTLLEVHVLIQVGCTFLTSLLWWHKPLDVNEHIIVGIFLSEPSPAVVCCPEPKAAKSHFIYKKSPQCWIALIAKSCYDSLVQIVPIDDSRKHDSSRFALEASHDSKRNVHDSSQHTPEAPRNSERNVHGGSQYTLEAFIVVTIGFFHALAWNIHFPTMLECWLWRICSIGMCISALGVVLISRPTGYPQDLLEVIWEAHLENFSLLRFMCWSLQQMVKVAKNGETKSHLKFVVRFIFMLSAFFLLFCYALCIIFITVEAYISIRNPPKRTFETPSWSDYWPHL